MQIAYVEVQEFYDANSGLGVFESLVDVCFLIDIVILFLTAYIDTANGETFKSPKKIAKHYIKNGFVVDFISTLPFFLRPLVNATTEKDSDLQNTMISGVTIFRLMKLLRVRKLNTLITNLQQPVELKSQLKRFYVIFLLVVIAHIQGCIIYSIVVGEQLWIPPTDFGSIGTDVFL